MVLMNVFSFASCVIASNINLDLVKLKVEFLGHVIQSPIKLRANFDLSFVTLRRGFLFVLFCLLF